MDPSTPRTPDPADLLRAAMAGDEATPWPAPPIAELAAAFPELVIHERIGQGGMAAVFRATQTRLQRVIALKVMRPDLAQQTQFAERFLREARALATLSNEHVLAIHDFGERAGFCFLVTEFVDGANLRELMQLGQLSPTEVLRIVPQICAGLHFAHTHGIVHRDVKPENVLVDRDGRVKLADFGLAKLAGDPVAGTFTRSGHVFGTPHYMAPEQWRGSAGVDHRADIYALGVLLYELLTGRLPVGTYAPASRQPDVPPGIDPIVQRSLQHEPAERYQSARDVQNDLELQRAALGAPVATKVAPSSGSAGRWLAAAIIVLVLGVNSIDWLLGEERRLTQSIAAWQELDESQVELAAKIAATVKRRESWQGEVPVALPPLRQGLVAQGVVPAIAITGGLATFLATVLLAAVARRRTRASGTSRRVHIAAGFVMAAPLVVAVLMERRWHPALHEPGFGPTAPLMLFGPIAVIALWAMWHTSGRRGSARLDTGPVGWPTRIGLGVSALLGLASVLLLVLAPREAPWVPTARLPATAADLLGLSRSELLDRLGPPVQISAAPGTMYWNYARIDGTGQDALLLTNGTVTGIQRGGRPDVHLLAEAKPASGAFPGQTAQDLVRALGPAIDSTSSANGSELKFAGDVTATVNNDGIVMFVAGPDGRALHQR